MANVQIPKDLDSSGDQCISVEIGVEFIARCLDLSKTAFVEPVVQHITKTADSCPSAGLEPDSITRVNATNKLSHKRRHTMANDPIHRSDDLDSALKWIVRGTVYVDGFVKHLPHTSQDLCDGKLDPEHVADFLSHNHLVQLQKTFMINRYDGLLQIAVAQALPPRFFPSSIAHETVVKKFRATVVDKFTRGSLVEPDYLAEKYRTVGLLKYAVDEACEQWADRLDRDLFRNQSGSFLARCPAYGTTSEISYDCSQILLRWLEEPSNNIISSTGKPYSNEDKIIMKRFADLRRAAGGVADGAHLVKKTCWECQQICEYSSFCGNCKVALYCSRECQAKAWKGGHKHKCKLLGPRNAAFQESLRLIRDIHEDRGDMSRQQRSIVGLELVEATDYRILEMSNCTLLRFSLAAQADKNFEWLTLLPPPSMKVFYENLERVIQGVWWLHHGADTVSYRWVGDEEQSCFMILCAALCYDFFRTVERYSAMINDGVVADPQLFPAMITAAVNGYGTTLWQMKHALGCMPSKRFLEMYAETNQPDSPLEAHQGKFRRDVQKRAILSFRDEFHK